MAYTSYGLTYPTYALNEMLRTHVPKVQNRVYPPDIKQDARTPRITITALTPTERRTGIGEGWASYKGLFYNYLFRVNIYDKDPKQVEDTADQVFYAVWKNRGYVPASPRNTYGEFVILEVAGGSPTELNVGLQLYQKTINVSGRWLSKASETW